MLIKRYLFLSIQIFIFFINAKSQGVRGIRIGGGIGKSVYIGSQMDLNFSFNTFGKSEFGDGTNFQVYKAVDKRNEFGLRYLKTEYWMFKNSNTFAINSKFTEISAIYQRSFNNNIEIDNKSKFTFNSLLGLGYINYSSVVYTINDKQDFIPYSSVGDGFQPVSNPNYLIRDKKPSISFIFGFNVGYRISSNFSIYYETSYSLSASNHFSGNLSIDSKLPTNGFSYSALSLYFNFDAKNGQLGCPKF